MHDTLKEKGGVMWVGVLKREKPAEKGFSLFITISFALKEEK